MKRIVFAGILLALALTGCSDTTVTSEQKPEAATTAYYLAGRIQASEAADLSIPFTGRVESVLATAGQSVKAGDPLIQFDTSEASAQVQVTRQALAIAQANLEKAQIGARPEQISQAEAAAKAAKTALDNAQSNLERYQTLYEEGAIPLSQLETAEGQAASAEAAFKNADEALGILKNGETKAYMAVLEKQVDQAQASVESAKTAMANRTVKAPFDGIVVSCPAKVGETYSYQTTLVSLENRNRLTVDAYGPHSAVAHFKLGQRVKVRVAELTDKNITGTVTWVGNTVDPKRRDVLVKISLEPEKSLMAGMFAEIAPLQ
jgi:multidrug resistance efflux pump